MVTKRYPLTVNASSRVLTASIKVSAPIVRITVSFSAPSFRSHNSSRQAQLPSGAYPMLPGSSSRMSEHNVFKNSVADVSDCLMDRWGGHRFPVSVRYAVTDPIAHT